MSEPCCSVGFTWTSGDGDHIKPSGIYVFSWLPKGYGPSVRDRTICALFDPSYNMKSNLGRGERHPLVEAIANAIEKYLKEHPNTEIGFLEHEPVAPPALKDEPWPKKEEAPNASASPIKIPD